MEYTRFYINNTKIALFLRHRWIPDHEAKKICLSPRNADNKIYTSLQIEVIQKSKTEKAGDKCLTNFDMDVADAIYTIYRNAIDKDNAKADSSLSFTTRQVSCVLSGNLKQDLTPKRAIEIDDSIQRLRDFNLSVSCKEEMSNLQNNNFGGFAELPFLACIDIKSAEEKKTATSSEKKRQKYGKKYKIMDLHPQMDRTGTYLTAHFLPLYYYAELNEQIISFSPKMLGYIDDKNKINIINSTQNIQLKRYLIRRIYEERNHLKLKGKPTDKFNIIYSRKTHRQDPKEAGLMHDLDVSEETDHEKKSWLDAKNTLHQNVLKILDFYKNEPLWLILDFETLFDNDKERVNGEASVKGVCLQIKPFS